MFHTDEYQKYLASIGRLPSTRRMHRYALEHFIEYLTEQGIADPLQVTLVNIRRYQLRLENRGLTPKTVVQELIRLKMYFGFLERKRVIFVFPFDGHRMPKSMCGRHPAVPDEKLRVILDSLKTDTDLAIRGKSILELAYSSALRPREIRAVKVADIDFVKGVLFIEQSKNRKDRIIPVGTVALQWLKTYIQGVRTRLIRDQTHPYVFVGQKYGKPLSREGLVWSIRETFIHSGLEPLPLYAMRASAATNLLEAGMGIVHIGQLLGHAEINTTRHYLHTDQKDLATVLQIHHPRLKATEEATV